MSLNRNHHGIRSRDRIYNARGNGLFTWHVLTIFISRAITWNTRGVVGNTYYHGNICKSLSRDVDVGYSPFASLFRATFFHLQSPCHPAAPLRHSRRSHSPFLTDRPRGIASDIRHIRGSLCFMANCFIIFDIFPVYGRGSAFCFMAVYCTWWTSLYVPPWIIPRPTPRLVFHPRDVRRVEYDKRHFFIIKMRSVFSHRLVEKYMYTIWFTIWKCHRLPFCLAPYSEI